MKILTKENLGSSATYVFIAFLIVAINLVWILPTIQTMKHQIRQNESEVIKRTKSVVSSFLSKQIHDLEISSIFLKQDLSDPSNKTALERILNNS